MNYDAITLKKYQKTIKKSLIIIFISLIISFFIYHKLDNSSLINNLKNIKDILNSNHINYLFLHFNNLSLLIVLILLGLGFIYIPLFFIKELISIFYSMFIFIKIAHFSGFLFSIIYNLITKGIYLILILILIKKVLNIYHLISKSIISKIPIDKSIFTNNLKFLLILILLIVTNEIFIYLFAHKIILKFIFILK